MVFQLLNIYEHIYSCIFVFLYVCPIVRFRVFDILESVQSQTKWFPKKYKIDNLDKTGVPDRYKINCQLVLIVPKIVFKIVIKIVHKNGDSRSQAAS